MTDTQLTSNSPPPENGGTSKRIAIAAIDGMVFVPLQQIVRCESQGNYTYVYTINEKLVVASRTLKDFEDCLTPFGFVRVHQSSLVNLDHIERYYKGRTSVLKMTDGATVPVSTRRREAFLENFLWV